MPKPWFRDAFQAFGMAREAAEAGDLGAALGYLSTARERELNEWFDLHAQNVGRFRAAHFGLEAPLTAVERDPLKSVARFERQLMERDNYTCRYCGTPVLPGSSFRKFRDLVGTERFTITGTNSERNGIKLVFSGTLDHVVPHSRGGRTSPENLVTCCWPCNYGKAEFTLSELGLEDPRTGAPVLRP